VEFSAAGIVHDVLQELYGSARVGKHNAVRPGRKLENGVPNEIRHRPTVMVFFRRFLTKDGTFRIKNQTRPDPSENNDRIDQRRQFIGSFRKRIMQHQ